MNSKKTNRINAIFSIVLLAVFVIYEIFKETIQNAVISTRDGGVVFFKNGIVDILVNNGNAVLFLIFIFISILSIISAIQNKANKKLLYWKLVLGISSIITLVQMIFYYKWEYTIEEWIGRIFFGIVPIIFATINLIQIKKNSPRLIQVISYIVVIVFSILILVLNIPDFELLEYSGVIWCFISIAMQLVYTHVQEDDDESKTRKIVNIIMYFVLQPIISVGLLIFIVYCLAVCKINSDKLKNEAIEIVNKISEQSSYSDEDLILVEKNSKYGFINEKGEEVVKSEYDVLSRLYIVNIDNKDCEFAFAKKDNNYYTILKNKKIINIEGISNEFFKNFYDAIYDKFNYNDIDTLMLAGINYLYVSEKTQNATNNYDSSDVKELSPNSEEIDGDINLVHIYNLKDGLKMKVTEIEKDEGEYEYNVKTEKNNQVIQNDKNVIIPIDLDGNIKLYSNGNIPFCNPNKNIQGWYDSTTGQIASIQGKYEILDATNNYYLLIKDYNNIEKNEMIIDGKTGNTLAYGKYIDRIDNGFIITDKNKKMYFVNEACTFKSQQYDSIIDISTKDNLLLVCINKNQNGLECYLMDSNGNILTKQSYSKIGGNINWEYFLEEDNYFDERTTEYCFDEVYEDYYIM